MAPVGEVTVNGSGGDEGESEAIVIVSLLSTFSESAEIKTLLTSLPELHEDSVTRETATERFLRKKLSGCYSDQQPSM